MKLGCGWLKCCGWFGCLALLLSGCATNPVEKKAREEKKAKESTLSTLRIHLEARTALMDFTVRVSINREPPIQLTVDRDAFLSEADVTSAQLVEVAGGFDLEIQFDHHGSLLLEQCTTSNPGRRYAVFCQFGDASGESRWLAGPAIARRITNGILTFTPDATRAEAEKIVLGLNNVAKKNKERNRW